MKVSKKQFYDALKNLTKGNEVAAKTIYNYVRQPFGETTTTDVY
jgi:hypothetical protein